MPRRSGDGMHRVVLFGDSNIDYGFGETGGYNPVAASYVSNQPYYPTVHPLENHALQLAGMIEALDPNIIAVNHGIGGTNTGTGYGWTGGKAPNAREAINGITRFEAEVLGVGAPGWTANGIPRVRAFYPGREHFAFVSLGTNDCRDGIGYAETVKNFAWMIGTWIASGCPPSHLLIATIPPTVDTPKCNVLAVNERLRELVQQSSCTLIDLAAHTTIDGETWIDPASMAMDGEVWQVHYTPAVRRWLAARIVQVMHGTPE